MADDIDIEEHDILDNPRVQNILPQISNIKTEPLDYQESYDEHYGGEQSECEVGFIENLLREDEAYSQDHERRTSSPSVSASSDEAEPPDSVEQPAIVQRPPNRIILGSKPCPKRKKIKHLSILLEDWSVRLNCSPCYCKDCKTLFATRNALDAHNMTAHSFLVALETPKEPQTDSHKYCNHCQKYFEDDDLLIQHLYDLITAKQAQKDVNNTSVPVKTPTQTVVRQVKPNVISVGSIVPVVEDNETSVNAFGNLVTCPICTCLFKMAVKFKEHCVKRHGLPKVEEKLASFTQACKICGKKLQNFSSYNHHIANSHADVYLKRFDVVKKAEPAVPKQVLVKRAKFKCVTCDLSFNSVAAAKIHQHSKHGKQSKIIMSKLKKKKVQLKQKRVRSLDSGLVPKNVLFKCDKCPVHTLNCIVAIAHRVNVHTEKQKGLWKCDICKRTFREVDKVLHKLQHQHTKEFKVYVLHENIYSRVLCRCPKCRIYFEERLFMRHTKNVCWKTSDVDYCHICKLIVNNMPTHKRKHEVRRFIKSDFILVDDFVSLSNRYAVNAGVKRKLTESPVTTEVAKRKKVETEQCQKEKVDDTKKILVYYCPSCQMFITPSDDNQFTKRQRHHQLLVCAANRKKFPCNICGLVFNATRSKQAHVTKVHAQDNIGVKDYRFVRITDLQPCIPQLPVLPKCHRCQVHYLTVTSRHSCVKDARLPCSYCKKTFDKAALKVHLLHHKYIGGVTSNIEEIPIKNPIKIPVKSTLNNSVKLPSEVEYKSVDTTLKLRYQKLIPTWNILYSCKMCGVTTDHYDYVVEHCQKHYNKLESYDVTIRQCEICSLSFESDCFNRHSRLHSNRTINRNDFKILQYDWFSLLTVGWTKIFEPLPKAEVRQILSRSIYVTPAVKMTLIVDGPPEYTIYECQSCAKIITADTVIFHAKNGVKCTKNGTKFLCSICNFCFATRFARDIHANIHKKQGVTANSFRVVAFNSQQEREFNSKLLAEHTEICKIESNADSMGAQQTIDFENVVSHPYKTVFSTPTGNKFRYFQCQECLCCVAKYRCILTHSCSTKSIQCPKCEYYFRPVGMTAHLAKHSRHKDFTRANIVIVVFNDEIIRRNKWTECQYCRLRYPLKVLATHIERVHQPLLVKPPEVERYTDKDAPDTSAIPSITLFRCRSCKCLFLDKDDLTKHQKVCNPNKFEGATCNKCGLVFHKNSLNEHVRRCSQQEAPTQKPWPYTESVFKCQKCNLYFTSRPDAKKHLDGNHHNYLDGPVKECGVCGWRFHDFGLLIHTLHHHKRMGKSIKDLTVVTIDKDIVQAKKAISKPVKRNVSRKALTKPVKVTETSVATVIHDITNDEEIVPLQSVKTVKPPKAKKPHSSEYSQYRYLANVPSPHRKVLFKCKRCDLHYVNIASWISHYLLQHVVVRASCTCSMCGLQFPALTLIKHEKLHHKITKDKLDFDVEIIIPEEHQRAKLLLNNGKIEEPPVNIIPPTETVVTDVGDGSDVSQSSIVDATTPDASLRTSSTSTKEHSHKIYKCGQCNVYFMAQSTCYIHMLHHTPMDPKEYIACKLCNLPFKIMSLNIHIRKHHKHDFNLEEVLVEEYSNDGGKTPKIDIYYAADKLQSRLVSTTTVEPVSQSSQAMVSSKNVNETHEDIKSVDVQVDSSDAGNTNRNVTALTVETSSSLPTKLNKTTTSNVDNKISCKEAENTQAILHECSYCDEKFKSNTSKEFHESLDHLDAVKDCQFCKESFNMSILNEIHLSIIDDSFKCCLCNGRFKVWEMVTHSNSHNVLRL